ncbi:MAG: tetratricopeptide repeat protein [Pseudomonadota bacterium]
MRAHFFHGLKLGLIGLTLGLAVPAAQADGIAGPYLAASQADMRNDYAVSADFYDKALAVRPGNVGLLNNAVVVNVIAGRQAHAQMLAERLKMLQGSNQIMALTRLAEALRAEDYALALTYATNPEYRLNPLMSSLVQGWAQVGLGEFAEAVERFDSLEGNAALRAYGKLHHALALALAGDFASAAVILDGDDDGPLHLNRLAMLTHIVSLSQAERMDEALALANDIRQGSRADPEIEAMVASLAQGKPLEFTQITTAAQGAASVFSILASALTREQAERLGLVYARLATHIRPSYDEVTTLIGDVLTGQGQYELAAAAFEEVAPTSAWYTTAEVGRAEALTGAERVDEAIEVLSSLARARPGNMSVITALGDILRREDDFSRAADAYDQAIDLIIDPTPADWRLFYVRGIAHERTDQWPKAEADFRKALELNPDQPHVLNYLGYSMVELQQNLDEALDMIERAVSQRPDDGYITDSLGWVLYRLGRYEEAVAPMERAVELLPVDPILNDHLGDVLWKVGRRTEAVFQWKRALSFDPLEKDAERIRRKLEVGLDVVLADEEAADPVAETALGD